MNSVILFYCIKWEFFEAKFIVQIRYFVNNSKRPYNFYYDFLLILNFLIIEKLGFAHYF